MKLNSRFDLFGGMIPDLGPLPSQAGLLANSVSVFQASTEEHEALIARHLRDSRKREALAWIKAGVGEKRLVGEFKTKRAGLAFVRNLYAMGAEKVIAVYIRSSPGRGQRTGKLIVRLPTDQTRRKIIFAWCEAQGDALGYSPKPDQGESHLFLLLE